MNTPKAVNGFRGSEFKTSHSPPLPWNILYFLMISWSEAWNKALVFYIKWVKMWFQINWNDLFPFLKIFSIQGHLPVNVLKITQNCQKIKQQNVDLALIPPKPIDTNAKFISKSNVWALLTHTRVLLLPPFLLELSLGSRTAVSPGPTLELVGSSSRMTVFSFHFPLLQWCHSSLCLLICFLPMHMAIFFPPSLFPFFLPHTCLHSQNILQGRAAFESQLLSLGPISHPHAAIGRGNV